MSSLCGMWRSVISVLFWTIKDRYKLVYYTQHTWVHESVFCCNLFFSLQPFSRLMNTNTETISHVQTYVNDKACSLGQIPHIVKIHTATIRLSVPSESQMLHFPVYQSQDCCRLCELALVHFRANIPHISFDRRLSAEPSTAFSIDVYLHNKHRQVSRARNKRFFLHFFFWIVDKLNPALAGDNRAASHAVTMVTVTQQEM